MSWTEDQDRAYRLAVREWLQASVEVIDAAMAAYEAAPSKLDSDIVSQQAAAAARLKAAEAALKKAAP